MGRAHGLAGAVRIDGAVDWFDYAVGRIVHVDGRDRRICERSGDNARPIVRLDGTVDREGAESLRGAALELDSGELPPTEAEAFWIFDLVGCAAFCDDIEIGRVTEVLERPANDVIVVDGGDAGELLVPFISEAVPEVDVAGRRIVVAAEFGPAADGDAS